MKVNQLFKEAVKKRDIKQVLSDDNFKIGVEFEYIHSNIKGKNITAFNKAYLYEDIIDDIRDITGEEWDVKDDGSIEPEDSIDVGTEIASNTMSVSKFLEFTPKILDYIQENGYTNFSCGLHINVSHDLIFTKDLDFKKLSLSLEDPKIYKYFPDRKNNIYAKSSEEKLRSSGEFDISNRGTLNPKISKNYIEFRGLGGKDYEYKWDHIKNIVLGYLVKLKKAAFDPNFMDRKFQSYNLKPSDVMSNMQMYKLYEKGNIKDFVDNYSFDNHKSLAKYFNSSNLGDFLEKLNEYSYVNYMQSSKISKISESLFFNNIDNIMSQILKNPINNRDLFSKITINIFRNNHKAENKFSDFTKNNKDKLKLLVNDLSQVNKEVARNYFVRFLPKENYSLVEYIFKS